ncbi:MAG: calcium-translocating P-type ATPase, PMCA-type [Alphaproteobacteria bacterium]|nr:calcium-translocating P-type ATPase, PMCA-type [Alphaproteobacteria bacterium]
MTNKMRNSTALPSAIPPAHMLSPDETAERLQVQPEAGLGLEEVEQRRQLHGMNRLPEQPARSALLVFYTQFKSILIAILFGAALIAATIGNLKDAAVILTVVFINAFVGFFQEYRAERSLAALKKMLPPRARVRRKSATCEISADDLVLGDVVLLEAGDRVPVDGRLWVAAGLEIDESTLTGESQPVGKQVAAVGSADTPLGDRSNMAYMNTMVTRGRAELIVTAIGAQTEMGLLSSELSVAEEPPTPLQIELNHLGKRLGAIALTLVGLLSFLEVLRGSDLAHVLMDAIALAVAAVPEGLPVVVTVTLALGMRQMARQRAIVRRLASVETLGCTTVICSDKTGTLTLNQMTARAFFFQGDLYEASGEGYQTEGGIRREESRPILADLTPFLTPLVACNDSYVDDGAFVGDPTEAALLVLAAKGGVSQADVVRRLPRLAEIPFDTTHKFMATFHSDGDQIQLFVKGAPELLVDRCVDWIAADGKQSLRDSVRQLIDAEYLLLAERGLRGLLVAMRSIPTNKFDSSGDLAAWVDQLTFVGLVGLMDPPRPEAKEAIAQCRRAGVAVKMITGDHQVTATAIARELGLEGASVDGSVLDRLDSLELSSIIDDIVVFARVTPAHKVKIVRALQVKGHVVAMTGDGVNDAPALKQADIGVAMGRGGAAVAKEAATMVLTDDNFETIVRAVRQGRVLYDNIVKFVRFQLSTTVAAILTVFFAPLAGLPEPFTPIQILWIAIIMDGPPAVSLALDAARPGIMLEKPRSRTEAILTGARVTQILAFGITMMVGTLAVLFVGVSTGGEQRALTMAFTTFVLFQFFNLFNARNENGTTFDAHLFDNELLWLSLAAVLALQAVAVHWPPAQEVFKTTDLSAIDWGVAVGVAAQVLLFEEVRKAGQVALRSVRRRFTA